MTIVCEGGESCDGFHQFRRFVRRDGPRLMKPSASDDVTQRGPKRSVPVVSLNRLERRLGNQNKIFDVNDAGCSGDSLSRRSGDQSKGLTRRGIFEQQVEKSS